MGITCGEPLSQGTKYKIFYFMKRNLNLTPHTEQREGFTLNKGGHGNPSEAQGSGRAREAAMMANLPTPIKAGLDLEDPKGDGVVPRPFRVARLSLCLAQARHIAPPVLLGCPETSRVHYMMSKTSPRAGPTCGTKCSACVISLNSHRCRRPSQRTTKLRNSR